MKKLVIFHPAIVPYRIDFFNSLHRTYETSFYFLYKDAKEQSFRQNDLKKRLEFVPGYLSPGLGSAKNLRLEVFSILRKEKPDMVFCSEFNTLGLIVLLYKVLYDRRLRIFTICDDNKQIAESTGGVQKYLRNFLIRSYTGIILPDLKAVDWYKGKFNSSRFIYFPIIQEDDGFRFNLERALPQTEKDEKEFNLKGKQVVLFVGRLVDIKNLYILIRAFSKITSRYPQTVLILVGEGDLEQYLYEEAGIQGIMDRTFFVGKKEGKELLSWYNLGQIFILPSYYERFGAVVNEALLAGCYSICSSVAGAASLIVEPKNGLIFDPFSEEELVDKMIYALNHCPRQEIIQVKSNRMPHSYKEYIDSFFENIENVK